MTIAEKVKALGLPEGAFVVVGSGVMDAMGIRKAVDIDIVVATDVFESLRQRGWQVDDSDSVHPTIRRDEFEVSTAWRSPWGAMTVSDLQDDIVVIDEVAFVGLRLLLDWKRAAGRAKDIRDATLIESHLLGAGG